ncbi:MAG TPA: HAMP domain-containing sensor histidine kinase [Bacillaceae bacterium]|nr:HAMP domain-containing sensor histidine kinase [Bacillaceae bacterium]
MMNQLETDVLTIINPSNDYIFSKWKEKISMPSNYNLVNDITDYGQKMFQTIFEAYVIPVENRDKFIKKAACEETNRELIHQIPLSFLINTANIARKVIFTEINRFPETIKDIGRIQIVFSDIIDTFIYYISEYVEEKSVQKDKNQLTKESHEERLTLLGQMTSSFVHEFRNPLTTIHGFIQLLRSENPELPYMDIISSELEQLKFRISQFLLLSRRESVNQEKTLFNVHDIFDQIIAFIYPRLLEFNVELERRIDRDLYIEGYVEEFRQVIINIIFNAIDVLAEQESSSAIKVKGYRNEDSIVLTISNTGPKIPDDLLATIFKPFVTTKKSGTGLGLYVCNDIIKKHNGQLLCTSNDEWTTFTIVIPIASQELEKRTKEH